MIGKELLKTFFTGTRYAADSGGAAGPSDSVSEKRKLKPVLDGDWWLIGPSPDFTGLLPAEYKNIRMPNPDSPEGKRFMTRALEAGVTKETLDNNLEMFKKHALNRDEPVDHHIFRGPDGTWHLWGCVRSTPVGRVLYHWKSDSLTDGPWQQTREMIRCNMDVGESIRSFGGEECIQSPYFIVENGTYYMFYGGCSTGVDKEGNPVEARGPGLPSGPRAEGQICLMTSSDGENWVRHKNADGTSRVFIGPGMARDPCLIKVDGLWHIYCAGNEGDPFMGGGCFARTSKDLINWSDYKTVHRDASHGGRMSWSHECPHVVSRGGYLYLFRTENYYDALTHVYRSEDPMDFGVDTAEKFVCTIGTGAPEIYEVDGKEYVSSNHDPALGTQMCRLKWVAE